MLTVQNLKKSFPVKTNWLGRPTAFVHAVDGVSFELKPGEHLGIVGESGSGKTTVARMLTGLYQPDSGEIVFNKLSSQRKLGSSVFQNDLTSKDTGSRRPLEVPGTRGVKPGMTKNKVFLQSIQMVFQDPYSSLDPRMTVYGILIEGLTLNPKKYPKRKDKEKRCREVLDAVGLKQEGILNRFPHEFSGGERQRIAIARALMLEPKILILDEAVSSLDILMQGQILELLKDLQRRFSVTYIFIFHNLKVIKKTCRHVIVMHQGKIVESGSAASVFNSPQHPYTQKLLSAALHYRAE